MTTAAMRRLLTKIASTKRAAMTSGKRGDPVAYLSNIPCSELFPITQEQQQRLGLGSPITTWQAFVDGISTDIKANDVFTVGGKDYTVRAVEPWNAPRIACLNVFVEELKT